MDNNDNVEKYCQARLLLDQLAHHLFEADGIRSDYRSGSIELGGSILIPVQRSASATSLFQAGQGSSDIQRIGWKVRVRRVQLILKVRLNATLNPLVDPDLTPEPVFVKVSLLWTNNTSLPSSSYDAMFKNVPTGALSQYPWRLANDTTMRECLRLVESVTKVDPMEHAIVFVSGEVGAQLFTAAKEVLLVYDIPHDVMVAFPQSGSAPIEKLRLYCAYDNPLPQRTPGQPSSIFVEYYCRTFYSDEI